MRTKLQLPRLALLALLVPLRLHAGAIVGATEFTQIANNIELGLSYGEHVLQTAHQAEIEVNTLKSYELELQNMAKLNGLDWQNATATINQLVNTVKDTERLGYIFENEDQQFRDLHKDYSDFAKDVPSMADLATTFDKWSKYNSNATNKAANAAGITLAQAADEQKRIAALKQAGASAKGQQQALDASNALAAEILDQLRILKDLTAQQMATQAAYMRVQEEHERYANAARAAAQAANAAPPSDADLGAGKTYGEMK